MKTAKEIIHDLLKKKYINKNEAELLLQPEEVISINGLMDHLKKNNLVVAKRNYFDELIEETDLKRIQQKLLKKPSLTPYEIAKYKLTHYTSLHGVKKSKLIRPEEIYKTSKGKVMIVTCAIIRIRERKHL